ncbi:hypothetical protein ACP70R_009342 [Stipagrostis hirtigluma subsp. patula]
MPRRARTRRPKGLAGIPEEILQEILVRLPAKSVLRCRAVCRSWRRLISDPAFLAAHHRHRPTLSLVGSFRAAKDDFYPEHLDAVDLQGAEVRPVFNPTRYCWVDASCDGLIVIGGHICNPATRQWVPLGRNASGARIMGLYRHPPSEEYRVLFWCRGDSTFPTDVYCPIEYRILTVGSDKPRRITFSVTPVEEELIGAPDPTFIGAPVLLHGKLHLHWNKSRRNGGYHKILVFDTVAESFRHMRPPSVNPRHVMQLFDMDGKLAASCSKDAMVEMRIFALQDYESEVWSFQYRIKLPVVEIRRFQEQGDWLAKIVSEEGDLLVSCFGWLLHCDRKDNLLAKFQYDDDLPMVIPHRYKESLIQHSFFEKKRKD